jgi:hypothetical protein
VRSELVAGARPKSCCGWCALTRIVRRRDLRGSLKTLARQIEGQLQADGWNHCAVYEHELIRVWPLDEPEREAKIAKFAKEYGIPPPVLPDGNVRDLRQVAAKAKFVMLFLRN